MLSQPEQMKQHISPLELTTLGEWRFVQGYIGKGSYGLVRLAYRTKEDVEGGASEEGSSFQSSTAASSAVDSDESSCYADTPKSFEDPIESLLKQPSSNELVAVKLFDKKKIVEKKVEESLKNEVSILKELAGHENIIKLNDVIQDESVYGIVTEYASGGDLLEFIKSQTKLSECQAKPMFRQIVSAVHHAHKKLVVHRDLKAENVFLTNDLKIKLGDWGLAAKYDPNNTINKVCGSIHYASPEIIQGQEYVGPEIDVWSLGVLLYAMTTGTLPFFGNDKDIKHRICRAKYQCPPYLSNGLVQLIEWMLQPNPMMRCRLSDVINHPWLKPLTCIPRFTSYHPVGGLDEEEDDLTSTSSSFEQEDSEECIAIVQPQTEKFTSAQYRAGMPPKGVIVPIAIPTNAKVEFKKVVSSTPPTYSSVSTMLSPKSSGAMSPMSLMSPKSPKSPVCASPPYSSSKTDALNNNKKKKKRFSIDKLMGKVKGLVCELVSGATGPSQRTSPVSVQP